MVCGPGPAVDLAPRVEFVGVALKGRVCGPGFEGRVCGPGPEGVGFMGLALRLGHGCRISDQLAMLVNWK